MNSRHRAQTFRPWLERLDDRSCPSCTLIMFGSTLFIHGDNAANDIDINVQGLETTVTCDSAAPAHFTGIDHLNIDTGQGNDRVQILIGAFPATVFRIEADLGESNDQFHLDADGAPPSPPSDLPPPPSPAGVLDVRLNTGGGIDVAETCIAHVAFARVEMDLGADNDSALVEYMTDPSEILPDPGELHLNLTAGAGDDSATIRAASFIDVFAGIDLGAGNDQLELTMNPSPQPVEDPTSIVHVIIDGGGGTDGVVCDVQTTSFEQITEVMLMFPAGVESCVALFPTGMLRLRQAILDNRATNLTKVELTQVGSDLAIDMTTGAGDDLIQLEMDPAADGSVRFLADTGGGDDRVTVFGSRLNDLFANIDLGAGNDTGLVEWPSDPDVIPGKVRELSLNLSAGPGDDVAQILIGVSPSTDVAHLNIDLGAGHDTAIVEIPSGPSELAGKVRELNLSLSAGAGDDLAQILIGLSPSSEEVNVDIDLGAGDDQLALRLNRDAPPVEDATSIVNVNIDGGQGRDNSDLDVEHYTLTELLVDMSLIVYSMEILSEAFAVGGEVFAELKVIGDMNEQLRDAAGTREPTAVMSLNGPNLSFDVTTGAGDDLIELEIDPVADGSVRFLAETRGGDDRVMVMGGAAGDLFADIDLGAGNDTGDVRYAGGGTVDPNGKVRELHLNLLGGAGDDFLRADVSSFSSDMCVVDLDGGKGRDTIRGRYQETASTGQPPAPLHFRVVGGQGVDNLALIVATCRPQVYLDLLLDGGPGFDHGFATPNAAIINCEDQPDGPPSDL